MTSTEGEGPAPGGIELASLDAGDISWVEAFARERWGSEAVVSRGRVHRLADLPGIVARREGQVAGLVTYRIDGQSCEIVSIDSVEEGRGVGTALIGAAVDRARAAGCSRIWLITTNDNLGALRFYQRRGFVLVALHRDAVTRAREQKPEIPLTGMYGIALRDELELEVEL
jgi:ribosomal protein S18 acetylase RimI-like enzyme